MRRVTIDLAQFVEAWLTRPDTEPQAVSPDRDGPVTPPVKRRSYGGRRPGVRLVGQPRNRTPGECVICLRCDRPFVTPDRKQIRICERCKRTAEREEA